MYLRFVTPLIHPYSGVESGFFQASWHLSRTGCSDWLREELREQFNWFDAHLPVPKRIGLHFRRRNSIYGICWFNPDAKEAIGRARYCAWLLSEGGLPVRTITTDRQREIIWEDAHQLVSRPGTDLPRAFS